MNKKDAVYEFLQNINRGSFADLLEIIDYESDNLDFQSREIIFYVVERLKALCHNGFNTCYP